MSKRQKCTQLNNKQIIAYSIAKFGLDHAITKATIAAHNSNTHKKPLKRVIVKKAAKAKAVVVAKTANVKAANNVVQLPKNPAARKIALKRKRAAQRVNNIINAANSFEQKTTMRTKPTFNAANITVVNRHRRVLGLKWLTQEQYDFWYARYLLTAKTISKPAYKNLVANTKSHYAALENAQLEISLAA